MSDIEREAQDCIQLHVKSLDRELRNFILAKATGHDDLAADARRRGLAAIATVFDRLAALLAEQPGPPGANSVEHTAEKVSAVLGNDAEGSRQVNGGAR